MLGWGNDTTTNEGVEVEAKLRDLVETAPSEEGKTRMRKMTRIGGMTVQDHFSLSHPSSHVAFAEDEAMVFVDNLEQITLEKKKDNDFIVAKQSTVASPGIMLLRLAYTILAFLMAGFVFVFCIQIVLFLFLGLAIESGLTSSQQADSFTFIGTLLSIPVFITGLSQVMTIAQTFVIDTWKGSKFMKTVISWDSTLVDWVTFLVFFGIPIIVGSISLCTGTKYFWSITSITWFVLVLLYYAVFALCALYYEVDGCLELVRYHPSLRDDNCPHSTEHSMKTFYRAIKMRLKQRLSGYKTVSYTASGTDPHPDKLTFSEIAQKDSFRSSTGLLSRLSISPCMSKLFAVLHEPIRQHDIDGVMEHTPYITNLSWGLESIYCRNRNARFVAIIDGEAALTKDQVTSSIACFIFGTLMTLFAIVSFLVWFDASTSAIVFVSIVYALLVLTSVRKSLGLREAYRKVYNDDHDVNHHSKSNGLYQVQETFRISEPRKELYWIALGLELLLFMIIPLIALFASGNNRVGIIFIFLSVTAVIRNVCNAPACLRELGSLDGIEVNNKEKTSTAEWREKHRLGKILTEISVGKRSNFWIGVFIFFVFAFCFVFISAVVLGASDGDAKQIQFASKDDFAYPGSDGVNYASCSMTKNIQSPDGMENSLADFTFLSTVAYLDDESATSALSSWFETSVTNRNDTVDEFKATYQEESGKSAVTYKLFEFSEQSLRIVAIRGTSNAWDALADAQLWSSAALAQYVRAIIPLGEFWTSVLPHLVKAVSVIEDKALKDVSYYKETSSFVKNLLEDDDMRVQVLGHSLGGGLAMITGAQTKVPAVGVSGPNNVISRKTFDPPLTTDDLDTYTFNIVPDRDPVPRIDDLSENYQRIKCRTAPNKPVDCHYATRSLCEILYTCGSEGRPIPCYCVNDFGYDEPASLNGAVFSQVCTEE